MYTVYTFMSLHVAAYVQKYGTRTDKAKLHWKFREQYSAAETAGELINKYGRKADDELARQRLLNAPPCDSLHISCWKCGKENIDAGAVFIRNRPFCGECAYKERRKESWDKARDLLGDQHA